MFFNSWSGIGFGKDLPNTGDVQPIDFLGLPLLLIRDNENIIRVFQNTCRHRGMVLISQATTLRGTIRCPYHSWCYNLDGSLRSTPHVGGPGKNTHQDIKRSELGLFEIKSYVWNDIIFIKLSEKLGSFVQENKTLIEHWKEFEQPMFCNSEDSCFHLELESNWKLAIENYCESYHLPWVHPNLNSYSRLEDHYHIEEKGRYSGQGSLVYKQIRGENNQVFEDFKNLSKKWDTGSEYISLFPNVLLGVHRDHIFVILVLPLSVTKTLERVAIYYPSENCTGANFKNLRLKNKNLWRKTFEEDIGVVEGMQKGRNGILFDGGQFSPVMDSPTHLFHEWVANRLMQPH